MRGKRIVQLDRRTRVTRDEAGVIQKFGVPPASIPDYLALVGAAADGYPGLPGWGAKSTAVAWGSTGTSPSSRTGHLRCSVILAFTGSKDSVVKAIPVLLMSIV